MKCDVHKSVVFKSMLLSVVFFMLTACGTVQMGRDFNVKGFEEIVGMAEMSKAQVQELLGAPEGTGITVDKDGVRLDEWLYFYGTGQLPSMSDTTIKTLQIRFKKDGMVQSYNWSYSQ